MCHTLISFPSKMSLFSLHTGGTESQPVHDRKRSTFGCCVFIWFPALWDAKHFQLFSSFTLYIYIYISLSLSLSLSLHMLLASVVACKATQNFQAASDATRISHACDMSAYGRIWSFPVPKGKRKQGHILWFGQLAQRSLGSLFTELYSSWKCLSK